MIYGLHKLKGGIYMFNELDMADRLLNSAKRRLKRDPLNWWYNIDYKLAKRFRKDVLKNIKKHGIRSDFFGWRSCFV